VHKVFLLDGIDASSKHFVTHAVDLGDKREEEESAGA